VVRRAYDKLSCGHGTPSLPTRIVKRTLQSA